MIKISKPKYGWSTLIIPCHNADCQIALSYIDDIAIYFLNEFMTYFETVENAEDTLVLTIDEEGNTKKIVADQYRIYIIDEGTEKLYVSDLDVLDFIFGCISEFQRNLSDWASFCVFEEFKTDYYKHVKENEKEIQSKIKIINKKLKGEL